MNYWTAFYRKVRSSKDHTYGRGRRFLAAGDPLAGDKEDDYEAYTMDQLSTAPDVVLALVKPTLDEMTALSNAVLMRYRKFAWLVFSPQVMRHMSCRTYVNRYSYRKEAPDDDEYVIIRNGEELVTPCSGCKDIMKRSCKGCSPPMYDCPVDFFDEDANMTLPDKQLYSPVKNCTQSDPFQRRAAESLLEQPKEDGAVDAFNSSVSSKGWDTRYLRDLVCPACMLYYKGSCVASFHPGHCRGVYLQSCIPKVSDLQYNIFKLIGERVDWQSYKESHKGKVELPRWLVDPELVVSGISTEDLQIMVSESKGTRRKDCSYPMLTPMNLAHDIKHIEDPVDWSTVSSWERFCAYAMMYKNAFRTEPTRGFGGGYGDLIYHTFKNNRLTLFYKKSGWVQEYSFTDVQGFSFGFARKLWYALSDCQHRHVMDLVTHAIKHRNQEKGNLAAVERFMRHTAEMDKQDNRNLLPSVDELRSTLESYNSV